MPPTKEAVQDGSSFFPFFHAAEGRQLRPVIDTAVKPVLAQIGGACELVELDGNAVYVKLTGDCAACAFSQNKLLRVVEKQLKEEVSPDLRVKTDGWSSTMVSVIVCSRLDPSFTVHERNTKKTAAAARDIEYIRIDNRKGAMGICAAYNAGVARARGDILVFMHEDAFFMEPGWDAVIRKKFFDASIGLVGVAGTQYLFADLPGWVVAGRPFIKGKVIHETEDGKCFHLTVFSFDKHDAEVVAVDGLFFAVRRNLFDRIAFDAALFDRFHFYDLDICMQIGRTHRLIVTPDILIKHQSGGSFDKVWLAYARRFTEKYKNDLPASCCRDVPHLAKRVPFESFDLKGKVPQITIA